MNWVINAPAESKVITCDACLTSGVEFNAHEIRVNSDGTWIVDSPNYVPLDTIHIGTPVTKLLKWGGNPDNLEIPHTCRSCNGFGVTKQHGEYKSLANAEKGIKGRTARACYQCSPTYNKRGSGKMVSVIYKAPCYSCSGNGFKPKWFPGEVFPVSPGYKEPAVEHMTWSLCDKMDKAVRDHFADAVNIKLLEGTISTMTALTGFGAMWSCTDYGRMYERLLKTDKALTTILDEIEAEIRKDIKDHYLQWTSIVDKDTKIMTDTVSVVIGRGGYAVFGHNVTK